MTKRERPMKGQGLPGAEKDHLLEHANRAAYVLTTIIRSSRPLQDRVRALFAQEAQLGKEVDEKRRARELEDSEIEGARQRAEDHILAALQEHASSTRPRPAAQRAKLVSVLRAMRRFRAAVESLDGDDLEAIAASHEFASDHHVPAMLLPHRRQFDLATVDRAIAATCELEVALEQTAAALGDQQKRADIPTRKLRRTLALLAAPWLPRTLWRQRLHALNVAAGVDGVDPLDNQTAFDLQYGDGWLERALPRFCRKKARSSIEAN